MCRSKHRNIQHLLTHYCDCNELCVSRCGVPTKQTVCKQHTLCLTFSLIVESAAVCFGVSAAGTEYSGTPTIPSHEELMTGYGVPVGNFRNKLRGILGQSSKVPRYLKGSWMFRIPERENNHRYNISVKKTRTICEWNRSICPNWSCNSKLSVQKKLYQIKFCKRYTQQYNIQRVNIASSHRRGL